MELPADLHGKVFYVKVEQQGIDECGYRSVYNAKAFDELLSSGKTITSAAINARMKELATLIAMDQNKTSPEDQMHFCQIVGIDNTYICEFRRIEKRLAFYYGPESDPKAQIMLKSMHENENQARVFFFCNAGDHWTNMILIKNRGAKPFIVYMNSQNAPLTKESFGYQMLCLLAEQLGI